MKLLLISFSIALPFVAALDPTKYPKINEVPAINADWSAAILTGVTIPPSGSNSNYLQDYKGCSGTTTWAPT